MRISGISIEKAILKTKMINEPFPEEDNFENKYFLNYPEYIKKIVLYHGTHLNFLESILKNGLQPRNEKASNYSRKDIFFPLAKGKNLESIKDYVYFSCPQKAINHGNYALAANKELEPFGVIIIEAELESASLRIDEDSLKYNAKRWWESLLSMHTIAHEGPVMPEKILRIWKCESPLIFTEDLSLIYKKENLPEIIPIRY